MTLVPVYLRCSGVCHLGRESWLPCGPRVRPSGPKGKGPGSGGHPVPERPRSDFWDPGGSAGGEFHKSTSWHAFNVVLYFFQMVAYSYLDHHWTGLCKASRDASTPQAAYMRSVAKVHNLTPRPRDMYWCRPSWSGHCMARRQLTGRR